MDLGVILVAAGSSRRAGFDKLYRDIGGETALERSFRAFAELPAVREIVVVSRADKLEENRVLLEKRAGKTVLKIVEGGESRTASVQNGLRALDPALPLCAVHDAARPFVSRDLILRTWAAAEKTGAACPVLPLKDTILHASDGELDGTVRRDDFFAVQTPQIFRQEEFRKAYFSVREDQTDDCSVWIGAGGKVAAVPGEEKNRKLTTPEDFEGGKRPMDLRIGHGYDAHRFSEEREMFLCGVRLPVPYGLDGVSDADAPLHALIDALFGAAGMRDIGWHFPPKDPAYRGISSMELLRRALELLKEKGAAPLSADITIVAEKPRLSDYIDDMRALLTGTLGCPVNVKATTEEKMGFTGRGEGLSAHAVVLLRMGDEA